MPSLLKSKAADGIALPSVQTLPWVDIAAMAALLAWLCILIYLQQSHRSFVGTDQIIHYFPAAQRALEGQGYRAFEADVYRGPGYPVALATVTRFLPGDMFAAGKVVAVTSSFLFLLFAYLLVRKVFDPSTALAAVLLTMAVNTFTYVSLANGTDMPFACLAMASLYFMVRSNRPSRADAILAGLLAGLGLTVRWTGLVLPLFMITRMALLPTSDCDLRQKGQLTALYLLGFLVSSGPWLYVNYLLHGSPLYTAGGIALDPDILPPSPSLMTPLLRALQREPLDFGLRFVVKFFGSLPMVVRGLNDYPSPGGWVMAGPFWVLIPIGILFLLVRIDRLKLWFVLISSIWWASLVPIHYEARFFILLIPAFAALAVHVFSRRPSPGPGLAPERAMGARLAPGRLLDHTAGSRLHGWLTMNRSGASSVSVVLFSMLAVTVPFTVRRVETSYRWFSQMYGYQRDLAEFVSTLQGAGLHRPIGVRSCSQARYWISNQSGTAVLPLPMRDYESVLPKLSFLLYDQIDEGDTLWEWCDDPDLISIADPLHAPATLEPVYYKPDSRRAILYRVLAENNQADIVSAKAASAFLQNPAAQAIDDDTQTWWSSAPHSSEGTPESITLDLGTPTPINRVWLLPRPGGQAFPVGLRIDVSGDNWTWQPVVEAAGLPEPVHQSPQVFSFSETTARFVRITTTQLRLAEDQGGHVASLAEVRVSLAMERPSELPAFSLAPGNLFYDPLSNEIVARVHNQGGAPGQATVEFSEGWSAQDARDVAAVESSVAEPGEVGFARYSSDAWDRLKPGDCRPIWATIQPLSYVDFKVDTYGISRPGPQTVYSLVCSPAEAVVDDFHYSGSPLERGWVLLPEQTEPGKVSTAYDQDLDRRVMRVSSKAQDGFGIRRWMKVYDRPMMTLRIRAEPNFLLYVRVVDSDGEWYYVQYMPFPWDYYPDEFPYGPYVYYPLGWWLVDGEWHSLSRDVAQDFAAETGKEIDHIDMVALRVYGNLELADLKLVAGERVYR